MRKRFFLPIFVLFVSLPILIFLFSYTRFFNERVRDILTSIVNEETNARLYIGEIHGSILTSFRIDGAALVYHDAPIALIDTIEVSHVPLSLLTRTAEVLHVNLINPRFYLTRFKDGTYNVDHISKGKSKPGGKFDWTLILRSLRIRGGEFFLYDSTRADDSAHFYSGVSPASDFSGNVGLWFDLSHFSLTDINLQASASLSDNKLSVGMKNISLNIVPAGLRIDTLRFDLSSSDAGTEVSNLNLEIGHSRVHADIALVGQNLLRSLDVRELRQKRFTASVESYGIGIGDVEKFIDLPINPAGFFNLECFASGSLDTLNVRRFILATDSSYIPVSGRFFDVVDSSMKMDIRTSNAVININELNMMLSKSVPPGNRPVLPDLGQLVVVDAALEGRPDDFGMEVRLRNGSEEIAGSSHISSVSYEGKFTFKGIDVGRLIMPDLKTQFTGGLSFSLKKSSGNIPQGIANLEIDSSSYGDIAIHGGTVSLSSYHDSLYMKFSLSTSKGNLRCAAFADADRKNYNIQAAFNTLDISAFLHQPALAGSFSGSAQLTGVGFDVDSTDVRGMVRVNHGMLGDLPIDSSSFLITLNTKGREKTLDVRSPFLDASVNGNFVLHELPSQFSVIFSTIAQQFRDRFAGGSNDGVPVVQGGPVNVGGLSRTNIGKFNASVGIKLKDARFLGRLLSLQQLSGSQSVHMDISSDGNRFSANGEAVIDTLEYATRDTSSLKADSTVVNAFNVDVQFSLVSNNGLSMWDSTNWAVNGNFDQLSINGTRLVSKVLKINYVSDDTLHGKVLSVSALGTIGGGRDSSLVEFYVDATGNVKADSINVVASTLVGKIYGVSFSSDGPVNLTYSPETFKIYPAVFSAGLGNEASGMQSKVICAGTYSLKDGADINLMFSHAGLSALQKLATLDTSLLRLNGEINGDVNFSRNDSESTISINFKGSDIVYNGSKAKLIAGNVKINNGDYAELSAQLSKQNDSTQHALLIDGIVPLSDSSNKALNLSLTADSLDISFLAPFIPGLNDFGGQVTGAMDVSGKYSSPRFKGSLHVTNGRLFLAVNRIPYSFHGTLVGQGDDRLVLSPLEIESVFNRTTETMTALGSLRIDNNTISEFNIDLNGTLLALNSTSRSSEQGIYGEAVVGSGEGGLKLKGSLARPLLEGAVKIQSADLTLLPLQSKSESVGQQIVYRFVADTTKKGLSGKVSTESESLNRNDKTNGTTINEQVQSSGSILDSLRYNLSVETKDNVGLMMIFDPYTNEKLYALLGGHLTLSNLSGSMVLTGDVNVQNNSYYDFYKHFAASGKLIFTGDPLNPTLDITAEYQGDHYTDTSTTKPQTVVVQIKITGTFNAPKPEISMTVDNTPFQGDPQTNAVSFILTGQFEDELTSSAKQTTANSIWSQAGAAAIGSFGSSVLSGVLTNLFAEQFSFIQSIGLQYNPNSNITDPNLQIRSKIGRATLTLQSPLANVTSDISNTGFSVTYPMPFMSNLVAEASRNVAVTNRTLNQRETVDMLRFYLQLSF
jgi:hypothetical protein